MIRQIVRNADGTWTLREDERVLTLPASVEPGEVRTHAAAFFTPEE